MKFIVRVRPLTGSLVALSPVFPEGERIPVGVFTAAEKSIADTFHNRPGDYDVVTVMGTVAVGRSIQQPAV